MRFGVRANASWRSDVGVMQFAACRLRTSQALGFRGRGNMKKGFVFALVCAAICAAMPGWAQSSGQSQMYKCDADFTGAPGHKGRGYKPSAVFFQVVPGANVVAALDPITYRDGKTAAARQKFGSDGIVTITWRFDIPTTAGYAMGGTFQAKFDPETLSGTLKSTVPARLGNGGTLVGVIDCAPVNSFPPPPA